jgi:hypothetical protein
MIGPLEGEWVSASGTQAQIATLSTISDPLGTNLIGFEVLATSSSVLYCIGQLSHSEIIVRGSHIKP